MRSSVLNSIVVLIRSLVRKTLTADVQRNGVVNYQTITDFQGGNGYSDTYYPYGYGANPPIDTPAIQISSGARSTDQIAFPYCAGSQWKFDTIDEGSVIVGNPVAQSYIKFNADGSVVIKLSSNTKVIVEGDVEATGNVSDGQGSLDDLRQEYNNHVHISNGEGNRTNGPIQ